MRSGHTKPNKWEGLISDAEGEIHYPSIEFFGEQEAAVQYQQDQKPEPWPGLASAESIEYREGGFFKTQSGGVSPATPKADQGCMSSCCANKDGYSQLEESWQVTDKAPVSGSPLQMGSFSPELLER